MKNFTWKRGTLGCAALVAITVLGLARIDAGQGAGGGRGGGGRGSAPAQGKTAASPDDWRIDPMRGPVDLGLTDPSLVGAIDVHQHLDPDAPGAGGQIRALDGFDAAILAKQRGMRGVVFKTHQDPTSAAVAYLVREHVSQFKGGWGRIVVMPTRDSCGNRPPDMDPQNLAQNRPWMLLMPPGSSPCVATAKNGELLPEVKYLIGVLAKIRTVDSNGRLVLATGHATAEEHLLLAREGRKQGLQVLLTHPPANAPQVAEAVQLGAFMEMNASGIYKTDAGSTAAAETVKRIGAAHIIVGTDCGQTVNVYPTDCLALAARGMRAHGVTQRELDLMYKVNPAKLLGLPTLEEIGAASTTASSRP